PLLQIPILVLAYPAALALLGQTAPDHPSALRRGWLCGLSGASACLYWIAVPVHTVAGQPLPLAISFALVLGAYIGLYGGLFSLLSHIIRTLPLRRRALLLGLGWFLLECLRNWLFTGFPWLPLAAAFVPWPTWIQACALFGAYGLGGLLAGLSCLALAGLTERGNRLKALAGVQLILIPLLAFGLWRLEKPTPTDTDQEVCVALIQGNIDQNQKWDHNLLEHTLEVYTRLSSSLTGPSGQRPDLVIWPETAMPFDYREHPLAKRLRTYSLEHNFWLLFGAPGWNRSSGTNKLFNRAYLIGPDGRNQDYYEKEHLVPFGEYVPPWLDLPFLRPLLQDIGDFAPGRVVHPLSLTLRAGTKTQGTLALGILICYETIFPELSRQRAADGAAILINISNDAWFGKTSAPEQHLQLSALRAVEQGRYLARGTNTGISAIVDPFGRIVVRGELFVAGAVSGAVRPCSDRTVFFQLFPWLLPTGAVIFGLLLRFPRRPARNSNPEC
ncbi:MAG: apolipoprotein N-acyltransferase, partial [Deltaproteobacteria bacterium]|nr:apolipoprotein N-acyltransferase [Deltaproteobacteria bacterium]